MVIIVGVSIWVLCAVLVFGIAFADFRADSESIPGPSLYRYDAGDAFFLALFGPVSLLPVFCTTGFAEHGLKFR